MISRRQISAQPIGVLEGRSPLLYMYLFRYQYNCFNLAHTTTFDSLKFYMKDNMYTCFHGLFVGFNEVGM
jgi:hypothetical protein